MPNSIMQKRHMIIDPHYINDDDDDSFIFPFNLAKIIKEKWLKDAHCQTPTSPGLVIATAAPLQASHTYI